MRTAENRREENKIEWKRKKKIEENRGKQRSIEEKRMEEKGREQK